MRRIRVVLSLLLLCVSLAFAQQVPSVPLLSDGEYSRKLYIGHCIKWLESHPDYPFAESLGSVLRSGDLEGLNRLPLAEYGRFCSEHKDPKGLAILSVYEQLRGKTGRRELLLDSISVGGFSSDLSLRILVFLALRDEAQLGKYSDFWPDILELAPKPAFSRYPFEVNLLCARSLMQFGQARKSLEYTAKAKSLVSQDLPPGMVAVAYSISGTAQQLLHQYSAARADFERVLAFCRAEHREADFQATQVRLAGITLAEGDFQSALALYRQALESPQISPEERTWALLGLNITKFDLGNYSEASEGLIPLLANGVDSRARGGALYVSGLIHYYRGQLALAESELSRALELSREYRSEIVWTLASLYWDAKDFEKSAEAYKAFFLEDRGSKVPVLDETSISRIYGEWKSGAYREAMTSLKIGLEQAAPSERTATLLARLGKSFEQIGERKLSNACFLSCVRQAKALDTQPALSVMIWSLFELSEQGDVATDISSLEKAYTSLSQLNLTGVQRLLLVTGDSLMRSGQKEKGLEKYRAAYRVRQARVMQDLARGGEQFALLNSSLDEATSTRLVQALKLTGKYAEAVEVIDDCRDGLLRAEKMAVKEAGKSSEGRRLLQELRILALNSQEKPQSARGVYDQLFEIQTKLLSGLNLSTVRPTDKSVSDSETTTVLRFIWLKDGLNCFIAVGGHHRVVLLAKPEERAAINAKISEQQSLLTNRFSSLPACRQVGFALYSRLLAPLSLEPKKNGMLSISVDDSLEPLAFEGLCTESGRYLCQDYAIVYGAAQQSAPSDLPPIRPARCLVVGGVDYSGVEMPGKETAPWPSLPGTTVESQAVARVLESTPSESQNCGKPAVVERLRHSQLAHLATHGYFVPASREKATHPLWQLVERELPIDLLGDQSIFGLLSRSGLVFARGSQGESGLLTALEIYQEQLDDCQLVVLSACDSNLGQLGFDTGAIGLRRSFLKAGAKSVVASRWKVSDASNVQLMEAFYRSLKDGRSVAVALNSARVGLIQGEQDKELQHPFFWAGYACSGNARVKFLEESVK